jgi:purine-cytosine permease-like protein
MTNHEQGDVLPTHSVMTEGLENVLHVTDEDVADYTESVVPLDKRRSNFRMLAQFLSMQATFGTILVGYGARFQGLSLTQLLVALAIATGLMTLYCIGSANNGASTGQTLPVLSRNVFGVLGAGFVSILLVVNGLGFYLFTVKFIMDVVGGLFTLPAVGTITAVLAFVMIVNTYFGFEGVQRFAQKIAVPVILLWGVYAVYKAFTVVTPDVIATVPHTGTPATVLMIAGAMIGLSTWGNEPDFFRYSKVGRESFWSVPTIVISYVVGAFFFPVLGYMVAAYSNQPDFGPSVSSFIGLTMLGSSFLGVVIIVINQWAVQDGNLYIAVNGAQNILSRFPGWKRQYTVLGLGLIAATLTFFLGNLQDTFTVVTGVGATTVPVASTIIAMDLFVVPWLFGLKRPTHRVASWSEVSAANWPAIIALAAGAVVGLYTAGLIPPLNKDTIGIPALQSWITGAVVYLIGVGVVARRANAREALGFSRI